jgi:hypothetical protein
MKQNNWSEGQYRLMTLLVISPWLFIGLIVFIAIIKSCVEDEIDPIDDSIINSREVVEHLNVVDSTDNGFRVVYATKHNVTKKRLEEIQSRPHIKETFQRLKMDAPLHFGNLLDTDIYDFADFAVQYDPDPAIELHNIFVCGYEKSNFYIGPNPKIPHPALYFNSGTEQGVQYLNHDDIYFRRRKQSRIYRYWKCYSIHATSSTDERYSHFSEEERLW